MKSSSSILIFAILICASFLCLYNLGAQPLHNDEARYAEIVTESFITGNHQFALYYRDQPYFNKTPLLFWFVDAAHVFDRDLQTDVRLPSAVCAILLVAAVMLIVFEITSNVYTTAVAGIILTTTASFIFLVRSGRFDSLATLALALATYSLLKASRDKRWFLLWGGALGIAFMAKGPIVVFAIVASIPILFLNLTWKTLWKEKFIYGELSQ